VTDTGPRPGRDDLIDVLRGVAILLVLLLHFHIAYRFDNRLVGKIAWNGNYGVTIFFVISGFLITANAIRRYGRPPAMALRDFYARRFARIAPPLVLMLTVVVLLNWTPLTIFQQDTAKTSRSSD
jgi:peptidoglycan/LPS O-acetylase OafA/YrhL